MKLKNCRHFTKRVNTGCRLYLYFLYYSKISWYYYLLDKFLLKVFCNLSSVSCELNWELDTSKVAVSRDFWHFFHGSQSFNSWIILFSCAKVKFLLYCIFKWTKITNMITTKKQASFCCTVQSVKTLELWLSLQECLFKLSWP